MNLFSFLFVCFMTTVFFFYKIKKQKRKFFLIQKLKYLSWGILCLLYLLKCHRNSGMLLEFQSLYFTDALPKYLECQICIILPWNTCQVANNRCQAHCFKCSMLICLRLLRYNENLKNPPKICWVFNESVSEAFVDRCAT